MCFYLLPPLPRFVCVVVMLRHRSLSLSRSSLPLPLPLPLPPSITSPTHRTLSSISSSSAVSLAYKSFYSSFKPSSFSRLPSVRVPFSSSLLLSRSFSFSSNEDLTNPNNIPDDNNNNNNNNENNNKPSSPPSSSSSSSSSSTSVIPSSSFSHHLVSPSIPFGQAPKSISSVLLFPIPRPIYPGLTFEYDISSLSPSIKQSLINSLNTNLPYIGLFLHRKAEEIEEEDKEQEPKNEGEAGKMKDALDGGGAKEKEKEKVKVKNPLSLLPPVTSLDDIYPIGVLAHFYLQKNILKGSVHRRIQIDTELLAEQQKEEEEKRKKEGTTNEQQSTESKEKEEKEVESASAATPPSSTSEIPSPSSSSSSSVSPSPPALIVPITNLEDFVDPALENEYTAYTKLINSTIQELTGITDVRARSTALNSRIMVNVPTNAPSHAADIFAAFAKSSPSSLQEIVETLDVRKRLAKTLMLLKKEVDQEKVQQLILQKVQEKFALQQQRHLLKEQKKVIDSMLGIGKGEKDTLKQKFDSRLKEKVIPEEAKKVIDEELNKFNNLESESQEYNTTRNYLDWLTQIPWGVKTKENFNIKQAEKVLNYHHYGMDDVKQRILEIIASGLLLGHMPKGKILCLVGPPGVGKTSIGKSIAEALNRQFYRFSVGGMDDVAEIKGHRRTYIGSMPGKLIQCLKLTQCLNPVILIDEIDKLGRGGNYTTGTIVY